MKFAHCLLPVLLVLRAIPAAADTLTDLFPPDTKVVFGIRVHNLALSSVVQSLAAQAQAAAAGWLKAVPLGGVDLLRDIDEVLIATSGKGQNPPAIIVVTGRFDVARLAGGAKRYHDVPLWTGEKETDSVVALLDGATAVIGDPALVRAAIDQRGGKGRIDAALNDRITSLRQRYDVWGLGEQAEGIAAPVPEAEVLQAIDRFQFGIQLASGLEIGAEIHVRSAEDAEKLSMALDMMAAMVKGQQASPNGAKFDLQANGRNLKLTVSIPEEELKKIIAAQTAGFTQASTESAAEPSTLPPAPAVTEAAQTGPNLAPEAPTAAAHPAPHPAPKTTTSEVFDKEGNTVVLTLPGKK
jgi:hypothetical protein